MNRVTLGKGPMVIADAEVVTKSFVCKRCGRIVEPTNMRACATILKGSEWGGELPHVWPTEPE